VVEFGKWLCEEVLKAVPHRHFVYSIPKILRRYFLYDRKLLFDFSRCGWETLKEFFREAVPEEGAVPGPLWQYIRLAISLDGIRTCMCSAPTAIFVEMACSE